MVTGTDTRLVPMTREQRDWAKPDVREAYDGAPTFDEAVEKIAKALSRNDHPAIWPNWTKDAKAALAALGWTEEDGPGAPKQHNPMPTVYGDSSTSGSGPREEAS